MKTTWALVRMMVGFAAIACGGEGAGEGTSEFAELERISTVEQALQASPSDDPNSVGWGGFRDMSNADFGTKITKMKEAGYRLVGINVHDGKYGGVWRQADGTEWAEARNLTSDQYNTKWQELKDKGYRPLDIEAYSNGGTLNFAGVWVKTTDGLAWLSYRNLTHDQLSTNIADNKAKYVPTSVDAYTVGNEWRYAVIWVENKAGVAWNMDRNVTAADYATNFDKYKADGKRVVDFESYKTANGQRYSSIWYKNTNSRGWASFREMTELGYANHFRKYRDLGYRLVDFERYTHADGTRYAAVWRQNGENLTWSKKDAVDAAIQDYVGKTKVPGLSVTVAVNGGITFKRGYGYADVAGKKEAHSETVYDAASVSKPIGTTLLMRLREANAAKYDLGKTTRSYVTGLPAHHTHTLKQLLNHTGCVRHYSNAVETSPSVIDEVQYSSQAKAAEEFWSDALICTPASTVNNYSTHAFTFVGAAIEAISGSKLPSLIQTKLNEPFGLESLRVKYPLVANYERAELYTLQDDDVPPDPATNKNVLITQDNTSWKTLGGGLEISAYDLARFGIGVRGETIVNATSKKDMWTKTVDSFGLGWRVTGTYVEHGGSAGGARSNIRIYTGADNTVITIMSNRTDHAAGGVDVNDLTDAIKKAMK